MDRLTFKTGMCRKLGPNCGYPQFRVIFAQKLGWCWVVGVNLPKLGSNYPNFTPISPPNCGKIGVKLVLWLGLGVVFHILIGLGVSKPHFAHPWSDVPIVSTLHRVVHWQTPKVIISLNYPAILVITLTLFHITWCGPSLSTWRIDDVHPDHFV